MSVTERAVKVGTGTATVISALAYAETSSVVVPFCEMLMFFVPVGVEPCGTFTVTLLFRVVSIVPFCVTSACAVCETSAPLLTT